MKPNQLRRIAFWIIGLLLCGMFPAFGAEVKVLHGHVPKVVSKLSPKRRLAETNVLHLAIGVPVHDPAGLEAFVEQVSDPASPNYRQFLSREELTERFGPTAQDYEAVKAFARSNGLVIHLEHNNRLLLDVTAPVPAIEKAFHVTMHKYQHPTEAREFYAPDTEPSVDASLPVADISGLSDYARPHPKLAKRQTGHAVFNDGTAPDGSFQLFGDDFRNAYVPGTALTGAGQIIGLMEFDGYYPNDISYYANAAGSGRTNIIIQPVLLDGFNGTPTDSGGETEVALDIEMAMTMAPGLHKIVSFEGGTNGIPNDLLNTMLGDSNILNLSCSWSWGEGPTATTDNIFKSMDAVGQSFFNASGDGEAFTATVNSTNGVDNPNLQDVPDSNPYIMQVGGTTLTVNGTGGSYNSEVVWNWGAQGDGSYLGSAGGISTYYAIPKWQANVSNLTGRGGSKTHRNIPDIAANADNVYERNGNGTDNDGIGGTSCAAPLWAGFMALVNQQLAENGAKPAGFINPTLYSLAATTNYDLYFNDVTSGDNTWPSSPNLFYATTNYDLCTGLGSMNGINLLDAMTGLPSPFFAGEAALGNNVHYMAWSGSSVFGYYSMLHFPYVYRYDMGWEYFTDAGDSAHGAYFYDFQDDAFYYTAPNVFPYLYDFKANAWLWYDPDSSKPGYYTSNPRWFYNLTTQAWVNNL